MPRLWMCGVVLWARSASADAAVDWATGMVTADGVGVADRHAPSPAAARGTSRRRAEAAARTQITALLESVPLASGGVVANRAADPAVKERLGRAVASAVTLAADPGTDGAWHVTLGVPIESVREAVEGRRALPADGDRGPQIVVVTNVTAAPAIGWKVGQTKVATRWMRELPAWAQAAPHIRASKAGKGVIEIADAQVTESTLVIIQRSAP